MMFVILTKEKENNAEVWYGLEATATTKAFSKPNQHTKELGSPIHGRGVFYKESGKFVLENPSDGYFLTAEAKTTLDTIEQDLKKIANEHKQFPSLLTIRG